ncbi:MAG: hypothetical protein II794_02855 [Oscillospiraceae bacterium]|nr:hypothetical protein [Oscillospiraceae bacterium]
MKKETKLIIIIVCCAVAVAAAVAAIIYFKDDIMQFISRLLPKKETEGEGEVEYTPEECEDFADI